MSASLSRCLPADLEASRRLLERLLMRCAPLVWMSPGKRSMPLVQVLLAAERQGLCRVQTHFDERAMAFAALGTARATQRPVLLVCTSGSAVANLLPALVEARAQGLCLVALTADRPPEDQDRACPQTWPHLPLLQGAVVSSWSLPCPPEEAPVTLDRLAEALQDPSGPLHINLPFREPFGLVDGAIELTPLGGEVRFRTLAQALPPDLEEAWQQARLPLITLGASWEGVAAEALAVWRERGAIVLADVLSQHAFQGEALRLTESVVSRLASGPAADLWIHLGGSLLSRSILALMSRWAPPSWVVERGDLRWDPAKVEARRWAVSPTDVAPDAWRRRASSRPARWPAHLEESLRAAPDGRPPEEAQRLLELFASTPSEGIFFVGNSMPIRHLAAHAPTRRHPPRVWANRGVNGIDGNLSTALGMATAQPRPVTIALGDLTTLHDLNALALGHLATAAPRLCVLNNGGGAIFRTVSARLPLDVLEKGFVTPHHWTFEGAARLFGWAYSQADSCPAANLKPLLWEPALHRA